MVSIKILELAKWFLIGLDVTTRFRLVEEIDRLAQDPRRGNAKRLAGTQHVYRVRCAGRKILYHEREGRLTILVIR